MYTDHGTVELKRTSSNNIFITELPHLPLFYINWCGLHKHGHKALKAFIRVPLMPVVSSLASFRQTFFSYVY